MARRTGSDPAASTGRFHAGELAVQRRAGVGREASRLVGMLGRPDLTGGIGRFLADRTVAALTARGRDGRLWISPVTGPPGFLRATGPATLCVLADPPPGDPLHDPSPGQPVGLLVIDFARRRRVRVNGYLAAVDGAVPALTVRVDQAYGNCPQYIHPRVLDVASVDAGDAVPARTAAALSAADVALVGMADTFLLGTTHPDRGNDASHRGGPPGFVRVEDDQHLWWPDFPGNNLFNSLGNLAVDPSAALLFVDFDSGATLHLSGTARVDWTGGEAGGTGRAVRFTVEAVVAGPTAALREVVPARSS